MPVISTDPGILKAAQNAIKVLLKFKGRPIVLLRRGDPINKPGGGRDFTNKVAVDSQILALSQIGDDIIEDGEGGAQVVKRRYLLTGTHDANIKVGDVWHDAEAAYVVDNVNDDNGFKVVADVTGILNEPEGHAGNFLQFYAGE